MLNSQIIGLGFDTEEWYREQKAKYIIKQPSIQKNDIEYKRQNK